jgi:hypothetical protein
MTIAIDMFMQTWPTENVVVSGRDLAAALAAITGGGLWIVFACWISSWRRQP